MNPLLWLIWKSRKVREGSIAFLYSSSEEYCKGCDEKLITFEDFKL